MSVQAFYYSDIHFVIFHAFYRGTVSVGGLKIKIRINMNNMHFPLGVVHLRVPETFHEVFIYHFTFVKH